MTKHPPASTCPNSGLVTTWLNDHRQMVVVYDYGWTDATGNVWWCKRGDVIDGASIPRFLWSMLGGPYSGLHRVATALHDSAYIAKVGTRKQADQMMLEKMLADGVGVVKARLMYRAVRWFGRSAWNSEDPEHDHCEHLTLLATMGT